MLGVVPTEAQDNRDGGFLGCTCRPYACSTDIDILKLNCMAGHIPVLVPADCPVAANPLQPDLTRVRSFFIRCIKTKLVSYCLWDAASIIELFCSASFL